MEIVTHDGKFHADEIGSYTILRRIFDDVTLVRTRSNHYTVPKENRIVIDIGRVYDPEKRLFDHHQREGVIDPETGRHYSSFGLVWKHFGILYIATVYKWRVACFSAEQLARVHQRFDRYFAMSIDKIDCGVQGGGDTSLSACVSSLNGSMPGNEGFMKASEIMEIFINSFIDSAIDAVFAEDELAVAVAKREHRELVVLERGVPWVEYLTKIPELSLVVLPNDRNEWMVQVISDVVEGVKIHRRSLPDAWGGLDDRELRRVSGVETAVFCHRGLFIAAARTKEDALKMAQLALSA